tara:strand:- start:14078 stop:14962 length:885 start_codon:yes stop_codon:yes gene_type:complete
MKQLAFLISTTLVCALSSAALAQAPSNLRLDYQVVDASCPDANQFADDVSAKLGFVPWRDDSPALRIRIRQEASETVATLELPSGDSKVFRDATCNELFPALVAATSVAIDSRAKPATPVQTAPTPAMLRGKAMIHIASDKAGLSVSRIRSRSVVVASNGMSASGAHWEELCLTPCSYQLDPGLHELVVSGQGPAVSRKVQLAPNADIYLEAKPGSTPMVYGGFMLAYTGPAIVLTGITFLLLDSTSKSFSLGMIGGGAAATGLGVGLMSWGKSELNRVPGPARPKGIALSGSF